MKAAASSKGASSRKSKGGKTPFAQGKSGLGKKAAAKKKYTSLAEDINTGITRRAKKALYGRNPLVTGVNKTNKKRNYKYV